MRTRFLCDELDKLNIRYFREPFMNIVTIHSGSISKKLAIKYDLVPQKHSEGNKWYKIVVMNHVQVEHLTNFIGELKATYYVEERITH
jgi:hypothetical protein